MKKRYMTLNKKWKEILFALSGFGPNLLMVLMGGYFTNGLEPNKFEPGSLKLFESVGSAALILPLIFPVIWFIAKAFDGIVDVPLAHLTDSLKTKWGKRRPLIAISFIPMVLSYAMCWIPIAGAPSADGGTTVQLINTIWICFWAFIFFTTYTLSLISFYGSLSTVCYDDSQRLRVSSFKSVFDTISYAIVYALVPLLLDVTGLHIDKFSLCMLPLMITMLIPLFIIKEGDKFEKKAIAEGYDVVPLSEEKPVKMWESIKLTFTNKPFLKWCVVNCCSFFGLQMFLSAMNPLIEECMGLTEGYMATILNTCAFAPVPLMLYLFNKLKAKKGIRFAYQTCLLSFAICILSFILGSDFVLGTSESVIPIKLAIGIIGGIVGSWAIGSFFMMPYLIPAQISSVEEKLTGKNHSAMYFAGQALTTSIIGALATSLYLVISKLFITNQGFKFHFIADGDFKYDINPSDLAAKFFNVPVENVFNFGNLLVPIFVAVFCIIGFIVAFFMPKNFSPKEVAKELKLEKEYEEHKDLFPEEDKKPYEAESNIVNIGLFVLTGGIFGFFWQYGVLKSIKSITNFKLVPLHFILGLFFFPYTGIALFLASRKFYKVCAEKNIKCTNLSVLHLILGLIGLNFVSLIILQHQLNKLHGNL